MLLYTHYRQRRDELIEYAAQRERGRRAAMAHVEWLRREADEARQRVAQAEQRREAGQ